MSKQLTQIKQVRMTPGPSMFADQVNPTAEKAPGATRAYRAYRFLSPPDGTTSTKHGTATILRTCPSCRARAAKTIQTKLGNRRMGAMLADSFSTQAKTLIGESNHQFERNAEEVAAQKVSGGKVARNVSYDRSILVSRSPKIMAKRVPTYREALEKEDVKKLTPGSVKALGEMIKDTTKRQSAINKIISESGISLPGLVAGTMLYEPKLEEKCVARKKTKTEKRKCANIRGRTVEDIFAPVGRNLRVEIGPKAFTSVAVLYSTIYHEYIHAKQRSSFERGPGGKAASELEASYFELKRASVTGIAEDLHEIILTFNQIRDYFHKLTPEERKKLAKDYIWARDAVLALVIRHMGKSPPIDRLRRNIAHAKDFMTKTSSELSGADRKRLESAINKAIINWFSAESAEVMKLNSWSQASWYFLVDSYKSLSAAEKNTQLKAYERSQEKLFKHLLASVKTLKPSRFTFGLDVSNKKRELNEVYGEMTSRLKTKYKRGYQRALKMLEMRKVTRP